MPNHDKKVETEEKLYHSQEKYGEVYEEFNRKRKEDKSVEEALFQVIRKDKFQKNSFADEKAIRKKQSAKKLFHILKKVINK